MVSQPIFAQNILLQRSTLELRLPARNLRQSPRANTIMAQVQDLPLSPHSSTGDGDSRKGSPDTRLTAPSPEESLKPLSKVQAHIVRSRSENCLTRNLVRQDGGQDMNKDPFVTPAKCTASTLSPTASSFSPFPSFPHDGLTKGSGIVASALSTDIGISRQVQITSHVSFSPSHIRTWFEVPREQRSNACHLTMLIDSTGSGSKWQMYPWK